MYFSKTFSAGRREIEVGINLTEWHINAGNIEDWNGEITRYLKLGPFLISVTAFAEEIVMPGDGLLTPPTTGRYPGSPSTKGGVSGRLLCRRWASKLRAGPRRATKGLGPPPPQRLGIFGSTGDAGA